MKHAKDENGKTIPIHKADRGSKYYCLACGEEVKAKIGKIKSYFSHLKDTSNYECEEKVKGMGIGYSEEHIEQEEVYVKEEEDRPIHLENGYNLEQWESITTTEGYIGVMGVPGAGKSKSLIGKIEYLIKEKNVSPSKILCISFTNKVVEELKERLEKLIGLSAMKVKVATMHSLCYSLLKDNNLIKDKTIITDWQINNFFTKEIKLSDYETLKKWQPNQVVNFINIQKSKCKDYKNLLLDKAMEFMRSDLSNVYRRYETYKENNKFIDFSDMLFILWKHIQHPDNVIEGMQDLFDYILFDEFNDANQIQKDIIMFLAQKKGNITFYMDARQSIYKFNGADASLTLDFEKNIPNSKIVKLYWNYRSHRDIVEVSNRVLHPANEPSYYDIKPVSKENGEVQLHKFYDWVQEARFVSEKIADLVSKGYSYNDFYILSRTNARSNMIEEYFIKNKIPYLRKNSISFLERKEIKDIMAYLLVVQNNHHKDLSRILNTPNRYLGTEAIDKIKKYSLNNNISIYDSLISCRELSEKPYWRKGAEELYSKISKFSKMKYNKVSELVEFMLDDLGYYDYLKKMVANDETYGDKVENLKSFINMTSEFKNINEAVKHFKESYEDMQKVSESEYKVEIMSIHAVKGLENRVCFVVGLEDSVLPHKMALDYEEERRMAFVVLSRAKEEMYVSYTGMHYLRQEPVERSEFVNAVEDVCGLIEH